LTHSLQGVALDSEAIRRDNYTGLYKTPIPDLEALSVDLFAYSGDDEPAWAWNRTGECSHIPVINLLLNVLSGNLLPNFQKVCTISANISDLEGVLERNVGLHGEVYWSLDIDVCICFGGTELKAYLEWKENVSGS
jgi:hypothetical protein